MTTRSTTLQAAIATLLALGTAHAAAAHDDPAIPKGYEKCYGVSKAGENSCGTAKHECASLGKVDRDPDDWKLVATGTCAKINGKLKPPEPAGAAKAPAKT